MGNYLTRNTYIFEAERLEEVGGACTFSIVARAIAVITGEKGGRVD